MEYLTPTSPDDTEEARRRQLDELARLHWERMCRFISRHVGYGGEAEDLTQQTFMEAARALPRFRGQSELSTWIYGIAMNLLRNHLSRSPMRRHVFVDEAALEDICSDEPGPEKAAEQSEQLRGLASSLDELPDHMQEVLLLIAMEDYSYKDVALLLKVPIGTIRSRLARARSALKAKLASRGLLHGD